MVHNCSLLLLLWDTTLRILFLFNTIFTVSLNFLVIFFSVHVLKTGLLIFMDDDILCTFSLSIQFLARQCLFWFLVFVPCQSNFDLIYFKLYALFLGLKLIWATLTRWALVFVYDFIDRFFCHHLLIWNFFVCIKCVSVPTCAWLISAIVIVPNELHMVKIVFSHMRRVYYCRYRFISD